MGLLVPMLVAFLPAPQDPVVPELLLLRGDAPSLFATALGSGGVDAGVAEAAVSRRADPDVGRATTAGGIAVECRAEGTHLRFPSGRELLLAPDGFVHLRDGGAAGAFGGGVALLLGDGAELRFLRSGSRRTPVEEVVLVEDGRGLRLWRRREPVLQEVEPRPWAGEHLFCLGDGGTLYRAIALGPLVTLRCVLQPKPGRGAARLPEVQLAFAVDTAVASLHALLAEQSVAEAERFPGLRELCRRAEVAFGERAANGDRLIARRIDRQPLRYVLPSGLVLQVGVEGAEVVVDLLREPAGKPFVQWRLGYGGTVRAFAHENHRQVSRIVRVPLLQPELAARIDRNDLQQALAILREL